MSISIRAHCIPAYDELSRLRKVEEIPSILDQMEEKTAGGIVLKLKTVVDSDYFKNLPASKVIISGGNPSYTWTKTNTSQECKRIWEECKEYI